MSRAAQNASAAERASEEAFARILNAIQGGRSFVLEAGAGAGKTYSLVRTLRELLQSEGLLGAHQRVACLTYTNVAKDEISARIDHSPLVHCDTIHAFSWALMAAFQKELRNHINALQNWKERLGEFGGIGNRDVVYELGFRSVNESTVTLHHDDVLPLMVKLLESEKFRRLLVARYPIMLIDEYQDSNAALVESIKAHFLGHDTSPLFGFFGDHWQKIYGEGCGLVEHPSLDVIGKEANFRSAPQIVACLNRMRPELEQFPDDEGRDGEINVFHTNAWPGARRTGAHWAGDLQADDASRAIEQCMQHLEAQGWQFGPGMAKVLMLTHRGIAGRQGYTSLPSVFQYNSTFTNKEHPHIEFFVDKLEPACEAFVEKKYGAMFAALDRRSASVSSLPNKLAWKKSLEGLIGLRETGTVGEVIHHLEADPRLQLPAASKRLERALAEFDTAVGEEMPRTLRELQRLHDIPYTEVIALKKYLIGHSPFETKHGVKGAEFNDVLVVVGRGWSQFNFGRMLEHLAGLSPRPATYAQDNFELNRNLFYVTCSRSRNRLALLFTQELSAVALRNVQSIFGADNLAECS